MFIFGILGVRRRVGEGSVCAFMMLESESEMWVKGMDWARPRLYSSGWVQPTGAWTWGVGEKLKLARDGSRGRGCAFLATLQRHRVACCKSHRTPCSWLLA